MEETFEKLRESLKRYKVKDPVEYLQQVRDDFLFQGMEED